MPLFVCLNKLVITYFWAVVGECSPDLYVFFSSLCMVDFVLYLSV